MECPHCHRGQGVVDGNFVWCNSCGVCLKEEITWVTSYSQPRPTRQQEYSRVKRFQTWVAKIRPQLVADLVTLTEWYNCYETAWKAHLNMTPRIYFFCKPVMLQVICAHVGLPTDDLPCLKDKQRERDQWKSLEILRSTPTWNWISQVRTLEWGKQTRIFTSTNRLLPCWPLFTKSVVRWFCSNNSSIFLPCSWRCNVSLMKRSNSLVISSICLSDAFLL